MNSFFRREREGHTNCRPPHQRISTEFSGGKSTTSSSCPHIQPDCCKYCTDKQRSGEEGKVEGVGSANLDGHRLSPPTLRSPHMRGNVCMTVCQNRKLADDALRKRPYIPRSLSSFDMQRHHKHEGDGSLQSEYFHRYSDGVSKHCRKAYQKPGGFPSWCDRNRSGNPPAVHLWPETRKVVGGNYSRRICNIISVRTEPISFQGQRPDASISSGAENSDVRTRRFANGHPSGEVERRLRCFGRPGGLLESDVVHHSELNRVENCNPNPVLHAKTFTQDFRYVRIAPELQKRILALEKEVLRSKRPNGSNSYPSFSSLSADKRTTELERGLSWLSDVSIIYELGYPRDDKDVDEHFGDSQGLPAKILEALKTDLLRNVQEIRDRAEVSVVEMQVILFRQSQFRGVSHEERWQSIYLVVQSFVSARERTMEKYRVYVRIRRWIENVASRRRKGFLSNRQNNILRLWLFSNFHNPYPTSEDKKKLVSETQLDINQINNWLINARSRVWKPSVDCIGNGGKRRNMLSSASGYGGKRLRTSLDRCQARIQKAKPAYIVYQ